MLGREVRAATKGARLSRCAGGMTTTISSLNSGRRRMRGVPHRAVHDGQVDRAAQQRRDRIVGRPGHQLEVDVRMRLWKRRSSEGSQW